MSIPQGGLLSKGTRGEFMGKTTIGMFYVQVRNCDESEESELAVRV